MNPVKLIKAKVQHYGYKTTYVNPLGFGTPNGEVSRVVVIYTTVEKDVIESYEIYRAGSLPATSKLVTVATLPDFITLQD